MTGPTQPPYNPGPGGGYPPQQGGYYPPQGPPPGYGYQQPPEKKRGWVWVIPVTLAVLIGGGIAAYLVVQNGSDDVATDLDSGGEIFGEAPNEIRVEAPNEVGPIPFSETPFAPPSPDSWTSQPVSNNTTSPPIRTSNGNTPGLYGGTNDNSVCDAEGMASFLETNQDKAQAWVTALNTDPAVIADWGRPLTTADIGPYIRSLTPLTLTADTRVTNNGFKNGQPSPRQAVLEKGTAVLVDKQGAPRARCYCGNPLTAPQPTPGTPIYKPKPPGVVVVINPNPTVVTTPTPFATVPPGDGKCDDIDDFDDYVACQNMQPLPPPPVIVDPTSVELQPVTPEPTQAPIPTPDPGSDGPQISADVVTDPGNTAACPPDAVSYKITIPYTDAQGDAAQQPWSIPPGFSTFQQIDTWQASGDGSAGTIEAFVCGAPGDTVTIGIDDLSGNASNDVLITLPPDDSPAPTAAPAPQAPPTVTGQPDFYADPSVGCDNQDQDGYRVDIPYSGTVNNIIVDFGEGPLDGIGPDDVITDTVVSVGICLKAPVTATINLGNDSGISDPVSVSL